MEQIVRNLVRDEYWVRKPDAQLHGTPPVYVQVPLIHLQSTLWLIFTFLIEYVNKNKVKYAIILEIFLFVCLIQNQSF